MMNFKKTFQASKKKAAILTTAVLLLTGTAIPYAVHAADTKQQHKPNPDAIAARVSDTYGVDKNSVLQSYQNGASFKDINHAAFLAQVSGKSFDTVLALKTKDKSWKDVTKELGVTKEQIKTAHRQLISEKLYNKLSIDKQVSQTLMQQGYHPKDIAMASLLSQNTQKTAADILALKKINNTWHDVATTVGVSDTTFKADMQKMHKAFGGRGHHHAERTEKTNNN